MKNILALSRHAARLCVGYVISFSFVMGAALVLVSCGGGGSAPAVPVTLSSIAITPDPVFVGAGTTLNLTATGTYSNNTTADITSRVTWTSAASAIASVGSSGVVTAGAASGVATTITATLGGISHTVSVSVTSGGSSTFGALNVPRYEHTATLLPGGTVLVAGGYGVAGPLNTAELFDPATGSWTINNSSGHILATARNDHTATLLPNGNVLVLGGLNSTATDLSSGELYNPATGWTQLLGILQHARSYHTATLLNTGKILVVGGAVNNSAELYDPAASTVAATLTSSDLSATGRYSHSATLLASGVPATNGKVLVVGGFDGITALASSELYDAAGSGVASATSLTTGRYLHSATMLQDGRVLVVGGIDPMSHELASAELYDPNLGTWSSAGNLTTARFGHTATLMPNGKVLVMGGSNASNPDLSSAELYDPATNTWSSTANLQTGRHVYSSTLLPASGVVLVVGGIGNSGTLSSVELHN